MTRPIFALALLVLITAALQIEGALEGGAPPATSCNLCHD